jgi:demethylmenaquinone methyltransferase/2-methoxy-6-polyprenyl-1,4-benzoquinol methylase
MEWPAGWNARAGLDDPLDRGQSAGQGVYHPYDLGKARPLPRTRIIAPVATGLKPVDKSQRRVRAMFASIARRYDLLNHLLSLNIDRSWRRFTARMVPPEPGIPVLDCCTGTADLALAYDTAGRGRSPILGADFCRPMLERGREKVRRAGASGRIALVEGDAQHLPFAAETFGVVTVAFGLRNVADTARGIDEMIRVARPGGTIAILEFSRPRGAILGRLYLAFFRRILPRVGQALAPNALGAYDYLPTSVLQFPDGQQMLDLLASRGLTDLRQYPRTFGIATLYVGTKMWDGGQGIGNGKAIAAPSFGKVGPAESDGCDDPITS